MPCRMPRSWKHLIAASLLAGLAAMPGCQLVSGMMRSYEESVPKSVPPIWEGLKGKTIGVMVAIDPTLHTKFPDMEAYLVRQVTDRLADPKNDSGVTGYTRVAEVIAYSSNNPGWIAKAATELGEALGGVDCVVIVEVDEFRLYDPGNMYTWDGEASGSVGVFDLTSPLPNEYAFRKAIRVTFPDDVGTSPDMMPGDFVSSALLRRFIDRATWPFYTHDEAYHSKY
jgi:hypothetical protein